MPERAIVRLSVGHLVDWVRILTAATGYDLWTTLALATYYQAATDHLDRPAAANGHAGSTAELSAYAVAQILRLPRETARRKVARLVRDGVLSRVQGGYLIPHDRLAREPLNTVAQEVAGLCASFKKSMAALTPSHEDGRSGQADPRSKTVLVMRLNNAFCLRLLDDFARGESRDPTGRLVFSAVGVANTKHLRVRAGSPFTEFDTRLPDGERQPVSALEVSRMVGVSRETARRQIESLLKAGILRRVRGGLIVNEAEFQKAGTQAAIAHTVALAQRFYAGLNRLG